jgi:UDP-N-acetylglucosamine 2-epimerase (non-hydrolysing)
MRLFEPVLLRIRPDVVVVVGDVNSTMACALVAAKVRIPVAHIEAGLRSFDRSMPEEINRLVTDSVSDIMFTTSAEAAEHLMHEGCPRGRIHFVGNVMIDSLTHNIAKARRSKVLDRLHLVSGSYALVTLHRPSNVDHRDTFQRILETLKVVQVSVPVVFPVHPRTRKSLHNFFSRADLKKMKGLVLLDPLGYVDFLQLMQNARFVVTDSGGIQEETTVLGIPCLTVRDNTERPITISEGTNTLVGTSRANILQQVKKILSGRYKKGKRPRYWDGKSADRIVAALKRRYAHGTLSRP